LYAKHPLTDGRQVQKKLGPAWTERERPAAGHLTKRQAEGWLQDTLAEARRGMLPGVVRTATFADAAAEFLRYVEHDRRRKATTVATYNAIIRVRLVPAFDPRRLEDISSDDVEAWFQTVERAEARAPRTGRAARQLCASAQGLASAVQSGRRCREAVATPIGRDRGLLAG
jgi:hypothetical protein